VESDEEEAISDFALSLQEILSWLKENNYVLLKNIDLPKSLLADGLEMT
jgi:hypothetical protein